MQVKKNVHVVGAERAKIAAQVSAQYIAGDSIRAIAVSLGRSYGFVHRLLEETSTAFRPRGGAMRRIGQN